MYRNAQRYKKTSTIIWARSTKCEVAYVGRISIEQRPNRLIVLFRYSFISGWVLKITSMNE